MPKTPDRKAGVSDEEGTDYEATGVATAEGQVRYTGTRFSLYDDVGEYDPRGGAGSNDEKVKVTSNDTTADFLQAKLVAGGGVDVTEQNDGGNETLEVRARWSRHFLLMGG